MNKNIYANSDEKFVKATVVFSFEDKIYYDKEHTEEVTLEDALNLFKKGLMLVSVDGGFKRPIGITVTVDGYVVSYGGEGGGGADFPIPEAGNDNNKVPTFTGGEIGWRTLDVIASYNGHLLVPKPTSEQEGYIFKVVSGSPAWVSAT